MLSIPFKKIYTAITVQSEKGHVAVVVVVELHECQIPLARAGESYLQF